MKFEKTEVEDVYIISPEQKNDSRGFFSRIYCQNELKRQGISFPIVQVNRVMTLVKGTVRGIHMQSPPYSEDKLISCPEGSIFDVIIDLRPKSETFKKWLGVIISKKNNKMIFVPKGCAHGYQTLDNNTLVEYPASEFYTPKSEIGIRWDDPLFKIKWPVGKVIVSEKDSSWPDFRFTKA